MENKKLEYAFVIDNENKRLSPTKYNKACYLVRKKRAIIVKKNPLTIKLNKTIDVENIDNSIFVAGIDDNINKVGICIVQKCRNKIKPIFKGTIENRIDIKKLINIRNTYHKYRLYHKRYRRNKTEVKSFSKINQNMLHKKQSVLRVIKNLNKYININQINLEDSLIDFKVLKEGYIPYQWKYLKKAKIDENIRKAVLLRDNYTCKDCGKSHCKLEVHHIKAKKFKGSNILKNLISLCEDCHKKTQGKEEFFEEKYFGLIETGNMVLNYNPKFIIEKTYLRDNLSEISHLELTDSSTTFNKRIDFNIKKSYSNNALIIVGFDLKTININLKDWIIKPQRKKDNKKFNNSKRQDNIKYE